MKTRVFIILVAAALVFTSCFSPVQKSDTGSISITVPALAEAGISGSSITGSALSQDYYAAVFVYKSGSEAGFDEVKVSSSEPTELTIRGIAEGDDYSLVVTIGRKERGALFPETYGRNGGDSFSVTGGNLTPVEVRMVESPFFYALRGQRLTGVAMSGSTIMTATDEAVIALGGSLAGGDLSQEARADAGFTVNSIDQGVTPTGSDVAWVSGPETRIVPFSLANGAVSAGSNVAASYAAEESRNILSSRGYYDDDEQVAGAVFQIDGGMGGGEAYGDGWGDSGEDLKDFVSGQPVLSVDIWEGEERRGLLATKIGTFAVTEEIFEDADQDELTEAFITGDRVNNDAGEPILIPITLTIGGENRRINALTAADNGGNVYLATGRGTYSASAAATEDGELTAGADAQLVAGTQGLQVFNVKAASGYVVSLTRSSLVVTRSSDNDVVTIPNVAGVPGIPALGRSESGVKGMMLTEDGGALYLVMTGEFGLAALNVGSLF